LAEGNVEVATQRLEEALQSWVGQPMDSELRFRVATNRLLLALLRQSGGDPASEVAFADARKALADVPQAEVDVDRLSQLTAILDFHEAKLIAARGEDAKALGQLMRATQTLNRLASQRPDSVVLGSELAACYLSSATILEGIGTLGDAREVRSLAMAELNALLKKSPDDFALRLELAGCYGAMAESAVLAGDNAGAESLSKDAVKLLTKLITEQPDNSDAVARMGAQLGLSAGLMRDRGQATEAMKAFDEGIRLLEGVRASAPDNATVCYRLALLWWQKGRLLGIGGKRAEEIRLTGNARDLLTKLEGARQTEGPPLEQIQRSVAYLLGDLGHALQLAEKKAEAKVAFSDAVAYWEMLLKSRPKSEEYEEGCAWCRQRLKDLK
jgi:tetratricopeptide (TPR) repeat protein